MNSDTGTCGDGLQWRYCDSVLTIYGTGAMCDFSVDFNVSTDDNRPWSGLNIKKIVIGDRVTGIGTDAFAQISSIEEVVIYSKSMRISDFAFFECENLEVVTFVHSDAENSIGDIGVSAFNGCEKLVSINLPNNGNLGEFAFSYCKSLRSIRVPKGTEIIEDGTFEGCETLLSVSIPETVKEIKVAAFNGCNKLKCIVLPKSTT